MLVAHRCIDPLVGPRAVRCSVNRAEARRGWWLSGCHRGCVVAVGLCHGVVVPLRGLGDEVHGVRVAWIDRSSSWP
jgi:hypothetical protein